MSSLKNPLNPKSLAIVADVALASTNDEAVRKVRAFWLMSMQTN